MQPPLANVFQPLINVFDAILEVLPRRHRVGLGSRDHRAHGAHPLAAAAADAQAAALDVPDGPVHPGDQEAAREARLGPRSASSGRRWRSTRRTGSTRSGRSCRRWRSCRSSSRCTTCCAPTCGTTSARAINPPGTSNPQPCGETAASHFLFIPDLTSRATGAVLVALIVLYVGSQLFSFLLSANPTMDKTQRMIFIALPFFFITHRLAAAGRPARVLDHHEHVDDRPGRDRAQAPGSPAPGGAGRAGGRGRTWRAG